MKFQVGDKVRILDVKGIQLGEGIKIENGLATVASVNVIGLPKLECLSGDSLVIRHDELKFIEKATKNQRITALEKEVAELKNAINEQIQLNDEQAKINASIIEKMNEIYKTINLSKISGLNTSVAVFDEYLPQDQIIEFEGAKYRKVDREARERDLVIFQRENDYYKSGKPYQVLSNVQFVDEDGDEQDVYNIYNRKPKYVDVYEKITEELTHNQQRAAIIEKAKEFVEEHGEGINFSVADNCVIAWKPDGKQIHVEGAKCHPNDVFNEWIGKAITIGRFKMIDVSEFEQAVQPTEKAIGMVVDFRGRIREIAESYIPDKTCHLGSETSVYGKIINDTNAQYEVSN